MQSGLVFRSISLESWTNCTPLLQKRLNDGEKVLWSAGSQAGTGAWATNYGRLLIFSAYYYAGDQGEIICTLECPEGEDGFEKIGFGHLFFYGISTSGRLYETQSGGQKAPYQWRLIHTDCRVVDVDGGTKHAGFVNEKGEAWTWGTGWDGVLGHGDTQDYASPKRVEWFVEREIKIVAIGCGGHSSWSGGFSLFLTSENHLYMVGRFPFMDSAVIRPVLVELDSLGSRHILSIAAGEDWAAIVASGSANQE